MEAHLYASAQLRQSRWGLTPTGWMGCASWTRNGPHLLVLEIRQRHCGPCISRLPRSRKGRAKSSNHPNSTVRTLETKGSKRCHVGLLSRRRLQRLEALRSVPRRNHPAASPRGQSQRHESPTQSRGQMTKMSSRGYHHQREILPCSQTTKRRMLRSSPRNPSLTKRTEEKIA